MTGPGFDYVEAIVEHSAGFAEAAGRDLDASVEHCPGWSVADLVAHLTEVHWFWGTTVSEHLSSRLDDVRRPTRAPRDQLLATFTTGADRLATVLTAANPDDAIWTWAPARQDVGFVIRHQVQEAAVHHWDAAHATGASIDIAAEVAADSIEEMLTVSLFDPDNLTQPVTRLDGTFALQCNDIAAGWTISDGPTPGTAQFTVGVADEIPTITAAAADLLLWLYERISIDTADVDPALLDRFRAL